jgi:ubiquinone/menaquinone biosynthesis C-methylase UbiE
MTEALVTAGARVIAVEQSGEMIVNFNRKGFGTDMVETRVGNAEQLPIEDCAVDRVFANMILHHVDNPFKVIDEMKRILKPGGRLVLTDLNKHSFEFLENELHDRWLCFYYSDIRHCMAISGLSNIIVSTVPEETCCASSGCDCKLAEIDIFMATGTA